MPKDTFVCVHAYACMHVCVCVRECAHVCVYASVTSMLYILGMHT